MRVLGLGGQDGGVPDLDGDGCLEGGAGGDDLHQPGLEGLVEGVLVLLLLVEVLEDLLARREPSLDGLGDLLDDGLDAEDGHCLLVCWKLV